MEKSIKKTNGFTLIELITTLIILGVVSSVMLPKFSSTSDFDEMGFFDNFISSVRYAQKLSIASHCGVKVSISASNFTVYQQESTCGVGNHTRMVVGPSGILTDTIPSGVSSITGSSFYFNASGAPITATGAAYGDQTLLLGSRSFKVHDKTGYVELL